jgi:hypothetical protein
MEKKNRPLSMVLGIVTLASAFYLGMETPLLYLLPGVMVCVLALIGYGFIKIGMDENVCK